jgi:hypothetical protein
MRHALRVALTHSIAQVQTHQCFCISNRCISSVLRRSIVREGETTLPSVRSDLGLRQRKQIDCRPAKIKEESPSVGCLAFVQTDAHCRRRAGVCVCVCAGRGRCLSQTALGHATHVRPRAEKSERDKARDAQIAACRQWLT